MRREGIDEKREEDRDSLGVSRDRESRHRLRCYITWEPRCESEGKKNNGGDFYDKLLLVLYDTTRPYTNRFYKLLVNITLNRKWNTHTHALTFSERTKPSSLDVKALTEPLPHPHGVHLYRTTDV